MGCPSIVARIKVKVEIIAMDDLAMFLKDGSWSRLRHSTGNALSTGTGWTRRWLNPAIKKQQTGGTI
jgi:hypothetical protein